MTGIRFGTDSKNENDCDGGDDSGAVLIRKCVRELHFFGFVLFLREPETLFTASWSPRQNAQNAHEAQQNSSNYIDMFVDWGIHFWGHCPAGILAS